MAILINVILLMLASIVLFIGIQFFIRNKVSSNKTRHYVLGYSIFSGLWCLCYGLIGLTDNFDYAVLLRALGIISINGFSIVEVFLLSGMDMDKKGIRISSRVIAIIIGIVDTILFANKNVATFVRIGNWTTWVGNPDYKFARIVHSVIVILYVVIMFALGVRWYKSNALKRQKRFIACVFIANFSMLFLTIPDTLLPMFGRYIVSTSGIGSAICTVVIWYGASILNSFDINIGNVFEKIYKFIDAGVLVFDMDYNLVLSNPFGERLIANWTKDKVSLADLFIVDEERCNGFFSDTSKGIVSERFEAISDHKTYSLKNTVLMDDYDQPYCYLCVLIDVTDEINMVNELEEANNAKTRFLTSISHEIRTPINAVLGFSEIITNLSSDEEILSCADNITRAGELLLSIINDLLDMSKITSGKLSIESREYDLSNVLTDVYLLHSVKAAEKGLSFLLETDEFIPKKLIGDPVRIQQIITNLVSNSIKYTVEGNVNLSVNYREQDKENIDLCIAVKDTGIGIREEDMPYLFDEFARFDSEKNRHIQGTGVGLSITKKLIDEMAGTIKVSSEYGVGTVFTVILPQKVASRDPLGKISSMKNGMKSAGKKENQYTAPNASVLAVDDNPMNLMVFGGLVKALGIKADTASEGATALEMIQNKKYDIVFLDHMMPDMDGVEVLKRIKEDKTHPNQNTPVIVMTANCIEGAKEEYLELGFDDFVGKPISGDVLADTIRKHISPDLVNACSTDESKMEEQTTKQDIFCTSIPGVDWNMAFMNTGDYELLIDLIKTFYAMADTEIEKINVLFNKICLEDSLEALNSYRIAVHAMKNSLALVGDGELSDKARELETACKDNDITFIKENHEIFANEYLDLAKRFQLALAGTLKESRRAMTNEDLLTNLNMIKTAVEEFDLATLNEMSFALELYSFESEDVASYVDEIRGAISVLDQERIMKKIDELQMLINQIIGE